MANQNELIRAIIEQKLREEAQEQQMQTAGNSIDRLNGITSKIGNFGNRLSNTGKFLNNNLTSGIGTGIQNAGNAISMGAKKVQSILPTSKNIMNAAGTKLASAIGSGATSASTGAVGGSAASGAAAGGPIGALIALGMSAIQGTNRKRAKQANSQTQQLAVEQNDIAKNRLSQNQQIAEILGNQNNSVNDIIQNPQENNLTQFSGDTKTLIDNYIQSSLNNDNLSNADASNITPNFNNQINEEQVKQGVLNNIANGFDDFLAGYKENKENAYTPNNLAADSSKGFMQRMGEGMGTLARIIKNPVAQGIVAGGLSTIITGNPLYGLGMAYKFTNNKKNSDLYRNILSNQGVDTSIENGTITSDDMSKILTANKYQKGFMTRKDYDRMRLENGLMSIDEYNQNLSATDYNPDEMINLTGLESVSKAGRYAQQNKNDRSANYYRSKNEGKNVIKVEYGEKPDSHNYTHVTYGAKPVQQNQTHVTYGSKPVQQSTTKVVYGEKPQNKTNTNSKNDNKNDSPRVKVQSPDGKTGSIPASQLLEAIKRGFKKL